MPGFVLTSFGIQKWYDRALDFETDGALNLTPVTLPGVITSRSSDKHSIALRVMSKREV